MRYRTTVLVRIAFLSALLWRSLAAATEPAEAVRIACVGDSITYGSFLADPAHEAYPAVLGRLLGGTYLVINFGVSGSTLMKQGQPPNQPYSGERAFADAMNFRPNIVIIALGTNDSTPYNWKHKDTFVADAEALIDQFVGLPSKPAVWVCLPPPAYRVNFSIEETTLVEIRAILRQVVSKKTCRLIDLETPLSGHPEWFPDGVHPNAEGADAIARTVLGAIMNHTP